MLDAEANDPGLRIENHPLMGTVEDDAEVPDLEPYVDSDEELDEELDEVLDEDADALAAAAVAVAAAMEPADAPMPAPATSSPDNAAPEPENATTEAENATIDPSAPARAEPTDTENKLRLLRTRKRLREVAYEYWDWLPPADEAAAKAEKQRMLELVQKSMQTRWTCDLCGDTLVGGEAIDLHLDGWNHQRKEAAHLASIVLPPRTRFHRARNYEKLAPPAPNQHGAGPSGQAAGLNMEDIKPGDVVIDRQGTKRPAERQTTSTKKKMRTVVKRCEVCVRDFVDVQGYEGHLKGKKRKANTLMYTSRRGVVYYAGDV